MTIFKNYKIGKMYLCRGNTPRVFSHLDSALDEALRGRAATSWLYHYPDDIQKYQPTSPLGKGIKHLDGNKPALLVGKHYLNEVGGYQLLQFLFGTNIGWVIVVKDFNEVI